MLYPAIRTILTAPHHPGKNLGGVSNFDTPPLLLILMAIRGIYL